MDEDWQELCKQAAVEQDPDRLLDLTRRINDILLAREEKLRKTPESLRKSPKPEQHRK